MTRRFPKAPNVSSVPLTITSADVQTWSGPLLRIAPTRSAHPLPFGALRLFGPVAGQRWDPHPPGVPQQHSSRWGVLYTSSTLVAACAETGQRSRTIDRHTGAPAITLWTPTRPLELLDLSADSTWAVRHRASSSLITRPAPSCQAWAHQIVTSLGAQIDGLYVPSTMTGTNVVLFGRAADTFPAYPSNRVPMNDPAAFPALQRIADTIGYDLI